MQHLHMSKFMKTMSNLEQNFRACLPAIAGREAFAVLEKPGGFPSKRVGADSPGAWLPAHTKPVPQALTPGGSGGSKREVFSLVKLLIFFAGQTLLAMPCSLSSRQAASQTEERLVSRLCVDSLPVVHWVKKPVYFLEKKCQGGCVIISTVFINPDIYTLLTGILIINIYYIWVIDQAWGQDGWILAMFFCCVFLDWDEVKTKTGKFSLGYRARIPSGQDSSILPAQLANHSARFGSSCPLTELDIIILCIITY